MKTRAKAEKSKAEKTVVIFRKWGKKSGGGIIAIFPYIWTGGQSGYDCQMYEHVGQHGGGDYQGVIQQTKPAKPKDYADLQKELRSIGYNLQIQRRASNSKILNNRRRTKADGQEIT